MKTSNRIRIVIVVLLYVIVECAIGVDSAALAPEELDHDHHEHNHHHEDELGHQDSAELVEVLIRSYGEDCADMNSKCNTNEGLICFEDVGKCDCNKQIGFVYSHETGKCQELPVRSLPESLDNLLEDDGEVAVTTPSSSSTSTMVKVVEDFDMDKHQILTDGMDNGDIDNNLPRNKGDLCNGNNCHEILGQYSKCEESTGKCVCHDTDEKNRSVALANGRCFIARKINDDCVSHDECAATIKGKAWCHMDMKTKRQFCQCEIFNYFDEDLQECLPLASDGLLSPCKTDTQCRGIDVGITGHGLGPHAACSSQGNCQCLLGPNGQKGFLYENYCFYQLKLGDQCNLTRECEVSLPGQDVHCHEESKTCECRNGERDNDDKCPMKASGEVSLGGRRANTGEESTSEESNGMFQQLKSAMGLDVPNFVFIMIIGAVVLLVVVIIAVFIFRKKHKYTVVRTHDTPERRN